MVSLWILGCVVVLCCIHSDLELAPHRRYLGLWRNPVKQWVCRNSAMSLATPHEGLQCGYHSKIALFHSAVISPELGWTTNHWLQWVLFSQPPALPVRWVWVEPSRRKKTSKRCPVFLLGFGPNENMSKWNASPWNTMKYHMDNGWEWWVSPWFSVLTITMFNREMPWMVVSKSAHIWY